MRVLFALLMTTALVGTGGWTLSHAAILGGQVPTPNYVEPDPTLPPYDPELDDAIETDSEKSGSVQVVYRVDVRRGGYPNVTSLDDPATRLLAASSAFRTIYPVARNTGLLAVTYADNGKEGGIVVSPMFSECCELSPGTLLPGDGVPRPMPRNIFVAIETPQGRAYCNGTESLGAILGGYWTVVTINGSSTTVFYPTGMKWPPRCI